MKVVITGATGRTSCHLVRKILARKDQFEPPVLLVRSLSKAKEKFEDIWSEELAKCFHEVDITTGGSTEAMATLFKGCDALVILTSAVRNEDGSFPEGGKPEQVDLLGQKNQVDAAKIAGVGHVVMVGTMGATKSPGPSNVFAYKRQSEEYLIESGLVYTIINPWVLVDEEEGVRELVFSKRDELRRTDYIATYNLSRADLAEVTMQSLLFPDAKNKAFDLLSQKGSPQINYETAFKSTTAGL